MKKRKLLKGAIKGAAAVGTFGGSLVAEKAIKTVTNKVQTGGGQNNVSVDSEVVERVQAVNQFLQAQRSTKPTGDWECLRCGNEWSSRRESGLNYWGDPEGPNVCEDCGSFAYTLPAPAPDVNCEVKISPNLDVVGESNYMDSLEVILGPSPLGHNRRKAVLAGLVPEPTNQYDKNAIMVVVENKKVGYISKDENKAVGKKIGNKAAVVPALIGAAAEKGAPIGVKIELI